MTSAEMPTTEDLFIPNLFCHSESPAPAPLYENGAETADADPTFVSYTRGVDNAFSAFNLNGLKFDRLNMNAILREISATNIAAQCGVCYEYSPVVADSIGGYPQGAMLWFFDDSAPKGRRMRRVMSCIPNNKYDYTVTPEYINGAIWRFVDEPDAAQNSLRFLPDLTTAATFKFPNDTDTKTVSASTFTAPYDCAVSLQVTSVQTRAVSTSHPSYAKVVASYEMKLPSESPAAAWHSIPLFNNRVAPIRMAQFYCYVRAGTQIRVTQTVANNEAYSWFKYYFSICHCRLKAVDRPR